MIINHEQVVYTAVFGDYDHISKVNKNWMCDFVCFTDKPEIVSEGWQIIQVELDGATPAEASRRFKMLPHRYFHGYSRSLYLDGNVSLVHDPTRLFEIYLSDSLIAIPKHQDRNCIYDEAKFLMREGNFSASELHSQMAKYERNGFPPNWGLTENNVILRRHMSPILIALMEQWWNEYLSGVRRDQISLPFLLWKNGIAVNTIVEGPRVSRKFFSIHLHSQDQLEPWIRRFTRITNARKHLNPWYRAVSLIVTGLNIVQNFILKISEKHP
jgi:hypothetical protein